MAPLQPQSQMDFDLAKCFAGEQQLVSWSSAYTALCDPETASKSTVLRDFLRSEASIETLTHPWQPWTGPSAHEKNKFEAKTAPISITPTSGGHYDLEEIKADTLWLSQQAKISEYEALRLVTLEWQSRPTNQLLSGLSQEEAVSVRDAAGLANLGASTFIPNSSIITAPSAPSDVQFDSKPQRQLRLIEIYHSSRIAILRISQLLISWGAANDLRPAYGETYRVGDDSLEQLGQTIVSKQIQKDSGFLKSCILGIEGVFENFDKGQSIWTVSEETQDVADEKWRTAQITELVHLLHLATIHADLFTPKFVHSDVVERWFSLMQANGFFQNIPVISPKQQDLVSLIQMLTSIFSLAVLKLGSIIDDLESEQYLAWDSSLYLLQGNLLENITSILGQAKELGPSPATVPTYAWALLLNHIFQEAQILEQARQHDIDNGPGHKDSVPKLSLIEEAASAVANLETSDLFNRRRPFEDLLISCAELNTIEIANQLICLGISVFGTKVDQISLDRFRLLFLQLIRAGLASSTLTYTPDVVNATHTILTGERSFRRWTRPHAALHADPIVSYCVNDPFLRSCLLDVARGRYPYEITPLLTFYAAIIRGDGMTKDGVPSVLNELTNFSTLMQRLPAADFKGYKSIREDENANFVALSEPLPQFFNEIAPLSRGTRRLITSSAYAGNQAYMVIPPGTEGQIVDDSEPPFIAAWHFPHSGLEYLVRLLSTYVIGSGTVEYSSQCPASSGTVSDIIGLFADLLHALLRAPAQDGEALCSADLLSALDIRIDGAQDTVNVILAVFDQELLRQCQEPGNEESLEILINCIHFLEALVAIAPNRVWPWLTRGRLLSTEGNGGSLATILIGTEMVLARYDFLIGCIRLFDALVEDAVGQAVNRKTPSKALTRFNSSITTDSGTSDKFMSQLLLAFGKTLASVYEGSPSWKYQRIEDRIEINTGISDVFTRILKYAYGTDDSVALSTKLTGLLSPVAEYITELYLSQSANDLPTNPILTSFFQDLDGDKTALSLSLAELSKEQTCSALRLSDTLVRIALYLQRPWTYLEHQLFKAAPLLARLYATSDSYKPLVLPLLETLVRAAVRVADLEPTAATNGSKQQAEPPSLLGHLGPQAAKSFLSILSQLDEPFKVVELQTHVWNLLSAVVTCKQQWFALYLLTGNTPRETLKRETKNDTKSTGSKALLSRAIESLARLEFNAPQKDWALYASKLEFVASAQNNWSWAMGDLKRHAGFVQQLVAFLKWMLSQPQDPKAWEKDATRSHQNRFAALTCNVLAMYLHSARQKGDHDAVREVVPSLAFLESYALKTPRYNPSLHSYLRQNLEKRFPGVTLMKLKRTTLYSQSFGPSYFYNTDLANQLLGFDKHWSGPGSGPNSGLASDLEKANINLSLVESQIQLLRSWKILATELSNSVTISDRLPKILINVVKDSMKANAEPQFQEAWLRQLDVLRGDLSFVLLQRMVNSRVNAPETRQLLPAIWKTILATISDFDNVFSSEQVPQYRQLLKILYLSLQFQLENGTAPKEEIEFRSSFRGSVPASQKVLTEPISSQLLEILSETVAKGFRSLATQLHSEPGSVHPSDFALLTAILQTILAIPEMRTWHAQAALLFTNSSTLRYATSLFSWSDRLTVPNNGVDDPIYGELSLLFILSLSSMQPLAETMAVDGILSQLNSANLMNYFRRPGGMSPFDSPPRLFSIWTKGILPLCLNILSAVGPPIAGEIAAFLNQFPEQLARASNALNSRTTTKITLSIVSEIHSLALISSILDGDRIGGSRLGIQANDIANLDWDKDGLKDDIDSWLARKAALRERIVVHDEIDAALYNKKFSGAGTDNVLEDKVLDELEAAGVCLGLGKNNGS
ncbi:hypothetical protein BU24DRAFT_392931 [Aaosphaeria arxii CBS 175.79]|uniref:Nucleoporin NUP188 n=1 Tax=Aaosphaeria arxii CBS 175.79 TaxID=1450172 RepID=A0A6A5XPA3_9PLEO|nr:uncharacterized protein BU24DRAFT_392931 [Aaosphaeria arxii CBS 175.79]KAF2014773.1 hypothetical protein BU24DRAFT_392931 [Aaosphaeria arxii CBS 175.79]